MIPSIVSYWLHSVIFTILLRQEWKSESSFYFVCPKFSFCRILFAWFDNLSNLFVLKAVVKGRIASCSLACFYVSFPRKTELSYLDSNWLLELFKANFFFSRLSSLMAWTSYMFYFSSYFTLCWTLLINFYLSFNLLKTFNDSSLKRIICFSKD